MSNNDFQFFTQDEAVEVEISNEKIIVINGGGDLKELEKKIDTNAKNIIELQKTAIREIPKVTIDGKSNFPIGEQGISKTGKYFVYAKFINVNDTIDDLHHIIDLYWIDENMDYILEVGSITIQDINHTDYVFMPINITQIPDGAVYLQSYGTEFEIHLFEETVTADVLSETFENTDRRFKEMQSALGSYITDVYIRLGGK